ncbi:hypothetical protein MRX96_031939 [Rhipicephalus microplus]
MVADCVFSLLVRKPPQTVGRNGQKLSVRVFEYPADASDHVLSRALEVYGKVQSISTDNLTGLRTTTGNRRARMKLRSPVPNITDVDGHVVRCEYDGVVRLCRKCMLPGHERKKCTTPARARCEHWGHPTCDAPCKRCGGDHPPHLCKQRLYSEATTRSSVPQVEPPTVGRGRSSRRRKRGGNRARAAAAATELSTSGSESSRSESTSPEYKRHAATAVVDDDSSSTTVEDSEINARSPAPCDLCKETYVHRLHQIKSFDAMFGTRSYWCFGASGSWGVAIRFDAALYGYRAALLQGF